MYFDWNLVDVAVSAVGIAAGSALVIRELVPDTRLNYSKFTDSTASKNGSIMVSSFLGMLLIYSPSLVLTTGVLLYSLQIQQYRGISLIVFTHYLKRVLEVIFVHRYSGQSKLKDDAVISMAYVSFALLVLGYSTQVPETSFALSFFGYALFIVGEGMNLFHHLLLRDLRKDGSKEYKIPTGGLFEYIWCPHYLGEILSFLAIVLVTQHVIILILLSGSGFYLGTRAYNTREWYKKKFDSIPQRACLIPFIF